MSDITDKYEKFKVPYSTNEKHSSEEFDPKENGGLDNPANRHKDKVLDDICDTHPGSPMCKVFDCWSRSVDLDLLIRLFKLVLWEYIFVEGTLMVLFFLFCIVTFNNLK